MNKDNVYWLFSSSAQTISALFAFLLAGFALVQAMMESSQQRDDSLIEIYSQIKRNHYRRFILLAVITGLAIVLSLVVVYLNRFEVRNWIVLTTSATFVDLAAIIGAITFVIYIINPDRYERTARKLMREYGQDDQTADPREFFEIFVKLEIIIRKILIQRDLYETSNSSSKILYSFRQMIFVLFQNQIITTALYTDLQKISKYRNVIFHGHETTVNVSMLKQTKEVLDRMEEILSKLNLPTPQKLSYTMCCVSCGVQRIRKGTTIPIIGEHKDKNGNICYGNFVVKKINPA